MLSISRLGAILILGFCLRVSAVHFGLPGIFHSDEPIVVNHALAYGGGDLNPHFFKIPPFVSYLLFAAYGFIFIVGKILGYFVSTADFENLFYADPSLFYLTGRILLGVIPGALGILALYQLTRRYFSETAALASALFLAVCFLHVRDSHYIYTDILLNLWMILAFYIFFRNDPHPKNAFAAGALIGLAAATKYNGAALGAAYVVYEFLARPKYAVRNMLIAGLMSVFVFICLNPFSVLDSGTFLRELTVQGRSQGGTPWFHHLTYSLPEAFGLLLFAIAFAACVRGIFEKDAKVQTLSFFCFFYYGILVHAGQPYDRYVLPLIPFLCLFAGLYWARLFCLPNKGQVFLRYVFLSLLVASPLTKSILWDILMSRQDVRTLSKSWIEANVEPGSSIALEWEFYMPRLAFSKDQLMAKKTEISGDSSHSPAQQRKLDFLIKRAEEVPGYRLHFLVPDIEQDRFLFAKPVVPYNLKDLKAQGIQYVITAEFEGKTGSPEFFENLKLNAEKIKTWSPFKNSEQLFSFDRQPLTGGPFTAADIASRDRNGYVLTLYRLH